MSTGFAVIQPDILFCRFIIKEASRHVIIEDEFDIHLSAVKKQQRVFKSILKLDKNFHVYIHGRKDLIEKEVAHARCDVLFK